MSRADRASFCFHTLSSFSPFLLVHDSSTRARAVTRRLHTLQQIRSPCVRWIHTHALLPLPQPFSLSPFALCMSSSFFFSLLCFCAAQSSPFALAPASFNTGLFIVNVGLPFVLVGRYFFSRKRVGDTFVPTARDVVWCPLQCFAMASEHGNECV